MKNRSILFSPPDITELEIQEVTDALRTGWITTGPRTKELEKKLAMYCCTKKTVCLNSGTAAEELNLRTLGIGEGDEVIVPAYTYTATAAAAIHCGAKVVFVDIQKDGDRITYAPEMDYDAMEKAINERTKAIIPVDIGGIICDYDRIFHAVENKKSLFNPKNLIQEAMGRVAVVADDAHTLGAMWHGKMAGEIADFTSFSFHAVKNFTTAEGGAVTWKDISGINDDELYYQYQLYSLHGQSKDALAKSKLGAWEYDIVGPWFKCNMTDVMAAMGLKQLERYSSLLQRRKEIINRYDAACDELGLKHLQHYGTNYTSSGHLYLVRIPNFNSEQRNKFIMEMAQRCVACNVHYKPLPMMTAYRNLGWDIKDFPNAYDYYQNEITLPLHTKLSDDDVEYVIKSFRETLEKCR